METDQTFQTYQPAVLTTGPSVIMRHSISDEELDILCGDQDGPRGEMIYASVGAAIGALPGAVEAICAWRGENPLSLAELMQIIIVCVALAAGLVAHLATRGAVTRSKSLKGRIRARGHQA